MLIIEPKSRGLDAAEAMCWMSASRERPFGCRGKACSAWATLHRPGDRLWSIQGEGTDRREGSRAVVLELGYCAALPVYRGEDEAHSAAAELRLPGRLQELEDAGALTPWRAKLILTPEQRGAVAEHTCSTCLGAGVVHRQEPQSGKPTMVATCPRCSGAGKTVSAPTTPPTTGEI